MTVYPAQIGPLVASVDVDQAVIACLKKWLPTYLGIVRADKNLSYKLAIPRASSYQNTIDDDEFPDTSLPGVFVATARTSGSPEVLASGEYATAWLVAISALVRGRKPSETRALASYYELAVRATMVQQLSHEQVLADSFDATVQWIGGAEARPIADPNGRGRWLGEGSSQFWVYTNQTVQEGAGPDVPDQQYVALANADTVTVDVVGEPQNANLGG